MSELSSGLWVPVVLLPPVLFFGHLTRDREVGELISAWSCA